MKRKKVLFITPTDIYDVNGNGGVKGSQKNFRLIQEYFGEENTYLCTFPQKTDTIPPEGSVYFPRVNHPIGQLIAALFGYKIYLPWNEKKVVKFIREMDIDLLFVDCSTLGRLVKYKSNYKTVVFYHNVEADYARAKVQREGWIYWPSFWASRRNDYLGTKADVVMGLNQRDSDRLQELYGRAEDYILPVTFDDRFDVSRTTKQYERRLLFLGSLFFANQEAVEWFLENVYHKLDHVGLDIVGKGFEKMRSVYEMHEGVKVIGSVDELDEYYYSHAAVVMPILSGAGMKVKTAEAMMFGRVIFASDEALEGYDVQGVEDIYRCNFVEEYVNNINSYFAKEEFENYSLSVREVFLNKYETSRVKSSFNQVLDKLLES